MDPEPILCESSDNSSDGSGGVTLPPTRLLASGRCRCNERSGGNRAGSCPRAGCCGANEPARGGRADGNLGTI